MGFLGRLKLRGRKQEHIAAEVKVVVEVCREEKEVVSERSVLWTPLVKPDAESEFVKSMFDAAHSPEVLNIKSSLLRDPTLDVLSRALSAASSTAVASELSAASSPATSTAASETSRVPKRLHLYDFKQIRGIGGGGFGSVYLVKHIPTGKELALKAIDKRFAREDLVFQEQAVLRDIGTRGLNGIMEFVGSFHNSRHFFILTEYCSGGDLQGLIGRWGSLPESLSQFYTAEIACAVSYLHDMGLVHRDLKPDNVFLSQTQHVVIGDFGFTKSVVRPGQTYQPGVYEPEFLKTACGTMVYMSPEQWSRQPYACPADVWSIGVIVFQMALGRTPWTATMEDSGATILRRVFSSFEEWVEGEHLGHQLRTFLESLLIHDPFYRPTLKEAMTHPWLGNIDWKAIASGNAPVPDVGVPPVDYGHTEEGFFGSFGGGGVYVGSEDPHVEFNYVSPILAAEGYGDDESQSDDYVEGSSFDGTTCLPPQDSFDDIPLDDVKHDSQTDGTPDDDVLPSPPSVIEMAPPPMLFGMACVTTTVTVTTEDEGEPAPGFSIGIAVAVQDKPAGLLTRVKSWLSNALSGVVRLCSRISLF